MLNNKFIKDEYETVWVDPEILEETFYEENYGLPQHNSRMVKEEDLCTVYESVEKAMESVGIGCGYTTPEIEITQEQLESILNGGIIALDIFDEYKIFLSLKLKEKRDITNE